MKQKLLFLSAAIFFAVFEAVGQKIDQLHLTLTGNIAVPSSEFRQAVKNDAGGVGFGVGLSVLANPKMKVSNSPFLIGVDLNYVAFGRDKIEQTNTSPPYKTSFNLFTTGLVLRLLPMVDRVGFNPFLDGTLGLNIVNARTKIDKDIFDTLNDEQDQVLGNTTYSGLGYGLGLGFYNRRIVETEEGVNISKGSFTLRLMYYWGQNIKYVKRGSLEIVGDTVSFETSRSEVGVFMIQLGAYVF